MDKVILEIRSAEGGDDAKLFVETLESMYIKFCRRKNFSVSRAHHLPAKVGYSEIRLAIAGEGAYS